MKPCDVKTGQDLKKLRYSIIDCSQHSIAVTTTGVYIYYHNDYPFFMNHKTFKRFAEWYLEEQKPKGE